MKSKHCSSIDILKKDMKHDNPRKNKNNQSLDQMDMFKQGVLSN